MKKVRFVIECKIPRTSRSVWIDPHKQATMDKKMALQFLDRGAAEKFKAEVSDNDAYEVTEIEVTDFEN